MIKIVKADIKNSADHQNTLFNLLNVYLKDKMGGGKILKPSLKKKLIPGLNDISNKIILFAVEEEKYIGMTICFITFSTFKLKKLLNIHDIIVLPEYRNRGIGKKLMKYIEKEARKLKCGKITLEVRTDNLNAKHLYSKLGFSDCNPPMDFWIKNL